MKIKQGKNMGKCICSALHVILYWLFSPRFITFFHITHNAFKIFPGPNNVNEVIFIAGKYKENYTCTLKLEVSRLDVAMVVFGMCIIV